jgi:hypothetical protein
MAKKPYLPEDLSEKEALIDPPHPLPKRVLRNAEKTQPLLQEDWTSRV